MARASFWLWPLAVFFVVLVPRLGNADWFITNPQDPSNAGTTYLDATGGGPVETQGTLYLFRWNGSFYGTWGSASPNPVTCDDIVGDWVAGLLPEEGVGTFPVGDYFLTVGWNPTLAEKYFSLQ